MTADQTEAAGAKRRTTVNEFAAGLVRGPVEVLDFFLPLWVGSALGASPTEVGLLIALETLTSFVVRPFAGVLADRYDRGRLAAAGAVLYALSFAGYVAATDLALAYPAAFLGGVGGALFWVALRARVGEGLAADDASYAKLFAAEGAGTWIAFVVGLSLVQQLGYRGVYAVAGAACVVAAVVLLIRTALRRRHQPVRRASRRRASGRSACGRSAAGCARCSPWWR
jgi:MFS family permease